MDITCRCCNRVNDIAVLTCECGQDLTRMASPILRAEVLAARECSKMWDDRPDDASMDGTPFEELTCCEKEMLCILGSGKCEGQCRVCEKAIKVRLS